MGAFTSVTEAAAYFQDDRFATENGIELIELTDDRAVARMVLGPRHRNAMNNVMGGAIFTLGDLAISALGCHRHLPVVGLDANINYLATAKGDTLLAEATCRKDGRTTLVLQADITDDTGRLVAIMTATAFKIRQD
ncbi:MAG: PaaI family thioesterase [Clostridia bacterium]|nr:PaaI family thioesterase [Clostridia bacterium]MBR5754023.1 PaaI family thioesterase [Clostridia bacterium]